MNDESKWREHILASIDGAFRMVGMTNDLKRDFLLYVLDHVDYTIARMNKNEL